MSGSTRTIRTRQGDAAVAALPRLALLLPLVVLLLGCAPTGVRDGVVGGDGAGPPNPSAGVPAVSPLPAAVPSGSATPAPTRARASRAPVVPQYRATVPPVAPERPVPARFVASSIGVDLPVVKTGVADDGRMQLPETNQEVAWYAYGSRPGDAAGTTVLAAHVDTRTEGLGPFARLRQLRRGAELAVTDAAGRTRRYTVTAVDDVPKSRVSVDQLFRQDGPATLRVLTCGGPFSRQTGYRDNIVVSAEPR